MDNLIELILASIWLMLPAYAANMAPVFAKKLKFAEILAIPVDLGVKIGKNRLFGEHKTLRGFVVGIIAAIAVIIIQAFLFVYVPYLQDISVLYYASASVILYGALLGAGALFGDLIKSFFKRRVGIKSGKPWPVFDEIDFVIGALAAITLVQALEMDIIVTILVISPILHVLANAIGRKLKIKD